MGGGALGPEKTQYSSIGECQDREAEVGGLVNRWRGFSEGNPAKGILFEM